MKELIVPATLENLDLVQAFIEAELAEHNCSKKTKIQIAVAVEEIYVNIAHYAYHLEVGSATIRCAIGGTPLQATIQFLDQGKPFNPLDKEDANITLSAEERDIGGLGILMVKKSMNGVDYTYSGGKNILTIRKSL